MWTQSTLRINLGDYESLELSVGASRDVRNNSSAINRLQRKMISEHEVLLSEKAEEMRELWSNK